MTFYLGTRNLSWESYVGICTDGAPSMTGSLKGFVSLVKQKNPSVATTRCFLHRKVLIAKTIELDMKTVLNQDVKMVNYARQRPIKSRLCKTLQVHEISTCKLHSAYRSPMALKRKRTYCRVFMSLERNYRIYSNSSPYSNSRLPRIIAPPQLVNILFSPPPRISCLS